MSTVVVATVKSNSSSPPVFQNTSGTEVGRLCRAWVNFNGTGTVAIRAQFNVSSITDHGVGDYTVNFTTALPDSNYAYVGTSGPVPGLNRFGGVTSFAFDSGVVSITTTGVRIGVAGGGGGNPTQGSTMFDSDYISLAVFR